jgi:hypothetical protein
MWPAPDALPRSTLCFAELLGGLFLANADAAQRLQFLMCRLSVGTTESCLRTHILQGDDVVYAADRAELEHHVHLLVEAGAEGCVTIIRHYIEEVTAAHIRCLQAVFETGTQGATPSRLALPAKPATPPDIRAPRREKINAGE